MQKEYLTIKENLDIIKEKMSSASERSVSRAPVILLGASKMNDADRINYAISCGLEYIGENRVQELLEKYDSLDKQNVTIHFIGHLQTNKVKYIIDKVDMIHSLDSLALAKEIDKQAGKRGIVMKTLVEINVAGEESKSGVSLNGLETFLRELSEFKSISVEGLMSVPPIMTDRDEQRRIFKTLYSAFCNISNLDIPNVKMKYLSMGMSDDYDIAIEEGANIVRVGSALFGKRNYGHN